MCDLREISSQIDIDQQNPSPGNIIWRTSRDAGFNGVRAVHAHGVEGLVVAEAEGVQINVGLGRCPRGRLTWKQ